MMQHGELFHTPGTDTKFSCIWATEELPNLLTGEVQGLSAKAP